MSDGLNIGGANIARTGPVRLPGIQRDGQSPDLGQDTLSRSGGPTTPQTLTPLDLDGLNSLTKGVRSIVLTYGIQDGQLDGAKEKQIKQNLTDEIHKLVPGGIFLLADKDASWSIRDMTNLYNILNSMPAGDRQQLSGVSFIRSHKAEAAEGASEAVKHQYGRDAAQLLGELGAGGESHAVDAPQKEGLFTRLKHGIGNCFVHSVEAIEGFLNIRILSDKTRAEYDGRPQRSVILTDTGSNLLVSNRIWAHEIGHQLQLSDGKWNPERVREFSRLSGWTETYKDGSKEDADGIDDRSGKRMLFNDNIVKSTRTDNFVSKYAKTDPVEDFAESYSSYLLNPGILLEKAPEKFLFINAESRKYTPEKVREFAAQAGINLNKVATELVTRTNLRQDTLDKIFSNNRIKPDQAQIKLAEAAPADALNIAWQKIMSLDVHNLDLVVADPHAVLGDDIWSALSAAEQGTFKNKDFMAGMANSIKQGYGSARTATEATKFEEQRRASKEALSMLLKDATFRRQLRANPEEALKCGDIGKNLPPQVVKALKNRDNRDALKNLCKKIDALAKNRQEWNKYQANLEKLAATIGPDHLTAFAESLNDKDDEDAAAKTLENAIKTGNLIFPGDGNSPPGG